ncbi:MAG: hypothetical protein IPG45_04475 [Deltaproteobacteria bacterium]|nr:hypothetical protein [Deltaproteobacteria bacterium]
MKAELVLSAVHRSAGDVLEADRLLSELSARLGRTPGPEAAAWAVEVSARRASEALADGDPERAGVIVNEAFLSAASMTPGPAREFQVRRLAFIGVEAELAVTRSSDPLALARLVADTPEDATSLAPLRSRMMLRLSGLYAARGEEAAAAGILDRLIATADPEVRSQALLGRGLARLDRGLVREGLGDLREAQGLDPGGPVDRLLRAHPALSEARDPAGRVIIRRDAGALRAGLERAFVSSQETPSWRKIGLAALGFMVGGPWGAAAGLALDGGLAVAVNTDRIAAATATGVSGVSRAALTNSLFMFGVDLASTVTAGIAGQLARTSFRLGAAVVAESAAQLVPRVVGAKVVGRGVMALGEGAVESLFGEYTARASVSILTGTPMEWSPTDALRSSMAGGLLGLVRAGSVPSTGLRAGLHYGAETTSAIFANELAVQLIRGARGEAPVPDTEAILTQLESQARIDLGLGLSRRFLSPLQRLVATADAQVQVRLQNAEAKLPPIDLEGASPLLVGAGPLARGAPSVLRAELRPYPVMTAPPMERRSVQPGTLTVTMDGHRAEIRYEDPRDKHTMLAELPAEEIARRYRKKDPEVVKFVRAKDGASQLGREAYEQYATLVRLAAEQGVEYKGHRWVEAPFLVGIDATKGVLTRWLRLDGSGNGRGGLNGAHLIPFEPRRDDLKALQLARGARRG